MRQRDPHQGRPESLCRTLHLEGLIIVSLKMTDSPGSRKQASLMTAANCLLSRRSELQQAKQRQGRGVLHCHLLRAVLQSRMQQHQLEGLLLLQEAAMMQQRSRGALLLLTRMLQPPCWRRTPRVSGALLPTTTLHMWLQRWERTGSWAIQVALGILLATQKLMTGPASIGS